MTSYWIGVIVAFALIFCTLVAVHVTCFTTQIRGYHFLFLFCCFLSWAVPIIYVIAFVGYMLYFIVRFIWTFFFQW